MRIIIIGASGLVGSSLYSAAKQEGIDVIGTYNTGKSNVLIHYDMRVESLKSIVPDLRPQDIIYILSAYSNPSWIFDNQDEARNLNLFATKRLIDEIVNFGSRIVFMSSVEVFDGELGNYNEESSPRPLNLYGKMKFEIEKYLAEKQTNSTIVRTGWNVGWTYKSRCVVKLTYETLIRPYAKMAKDNVFSIIDVRDTARGLLEIGKKSSMKICHLASTPLIFRTELASYIMNFSKYKDRMSYDEGLFSEIPYSEPRSRLNHLDNSLAVSSLGITFRNPEEIIRQKVDLIDNYITYLKT